MRSVHLGEDRAPKVHSSGTSGFSEFLRIDTQGQAELGKQNLYWTPALLTPQSRVLVQVRPVQLQPVALSQNGCPSSLFPKPFSGVSSCQVHWQDASGLQNDLGLCSSASRYLPLGMPICTSLKNIVILEQTHHAALFPVS